MSKLTWTNIEQGSYSGETDRRLLVITKQSEWKQLWAKHTSRQLPTQAVPKVDFRKEMVIALFAGEFSSGGLSISLERIEDDGRNLVVTFKESGSRGSGVSTAFSQPFHIVRLARSRKPVGFQRDVGPAGSKVTVVNDDGQVVAEQG